MATTNSILQDWVQALGLRHQGVLLTAVRGCDAAPKNDPSKMFVRCYRAAVLKAHCGDAKKAATFIEHVDGDELLRRFNALRNNLDHYPVHYIMHLMHAVEIVGYKRPDEFAALWKGFYFSFCVAFHLEPESCAALDNRLNLSETEFAARN
jgi:hypothetical protein